MKLFSEHPLQKKILLIVSCLVFLPYLALSVIIFSYFRTSSENRKEQMYTSMLHIAELMIDHRLAQIENRVDSLTVSSPY